MTAAARLGNRVHQRGRHRRALARGRLLGATEAARHGALILAAVGDDLYNVILALHVVSFVIAFAPVIAHPVMNIQSRSASPESRTTILRFIAQNGQRIYAPALIVTGGLGIVLILVSDDAWEFSQGWVSASFAVWIAMNGVLHAVLLPAERKLADGDASVEKRVEITGMVLTVLFLVMVVLMIWKPGL